MKTRHNFCGKFHHIPKKQQKAKKKSTQTSRKDLVISDAFLTKWKVKKKNRDREARREMMKAKQDEISNKQTNKKKMLSLYRYIKVSTWQGTKKKFKYKRKLEWEIKYESVCCIFRIGSA